MLFTFVSVDTDEWGIFSRRGDFHSLRSILSTYICTDFCETSNIFVEISPRLVKELTPSLQTCIVEL